MKALILTLATLGLMASTSFAQESTGAGQSYQQDSKHTDLAEFDHLDPNEIVPERPLKQALTYFKAHRDKFPNQNYIVVVDYTQPSSHKRMYVINLKSGKVEAHATSHGRGSDPSHSGFAKSFSNQDSSHKTSLGFFRTAETYVGAHGKSLRLDGLSPTNSNARNRAIVIHAANYVTDRQSRIMGRSHGCPAVDPGVLNPLISKIKSGALMYSWAGQ